MPGIHAHTGKTLDGAEHIRQSIADIITTPLGSRVMRRDYGSVVPDLIDHPLNNVTLLRLYAATALAILRWEPRIQLSRIQWTSRDGAAVIELEYSYGGETLASYVVLNAQRGAP